MRKAPALQALVAALALAMPGLSSLAHDDEALHAVCPEHGELVHIAPNAPRPDARTDSWSLGSEAAEHEHCGLAWSLRDRAESAARLVVAATVELWTEPAPERSTRRIASLLHYAPKASPPAHG